MTHNDKNNLITALVKNNINFKKLDDFIEDEIESISEDVHNSWWRGKESNGYHPPLNCKIKFNPEIHKDEKHSERCDKCHESMYPYNELKDSTQEYDRATVRQTTKSIIEIASKNEGLVLCLL